MNKIEKAVNCFNQGFACSQAILSTYSEEFGLNKDIAVKVAQGFGGGMGRMADICGAVTGAFMVIGLKYGMKDVVDKEAKEKTYKLVKEFADRFKLRNKTIVCRELLCCDMSTKEGMRIIKEKNLFTTLCPKFVQDATEILEEIL